MLHLYALTQHPARLPEVRGLADAALSAAEVDGIDAVLSQTAGNIGEATEEAILAHARVVEELAALNDGVLPARLDGAYENEAALVAAVRRRAPQLAEALERVRGCTEMGVRVLQEPKHGSAQAESGSKYMRGRLEEIRHAGRVASDVDEAVQVFVRGSTKRVLASQQLVVSVAYLLPRSEVDSFRSAVETAEQAWPDLTFVCTGPWPPYSFVLVDGDPLGPA